jgi:18S rRNA (adenine1779-N6/adenine1780-N6)-dimethyltransferase
MAIRRPTTIRPGNTPYSSNLPHRTHNTANKPTQSKLSLPMNKAFGQHLLRNPGILQQIIEAANIKQSDTVLEIGPGTGNLTVKLCPLAKKVIAMEIDARMIAEVKKRAAVLGLMNLQVIEGDAIKTEFPTQFDVCVANLPYQISSPFTFKLLQSKFRCAVVMFQKEFAERLVAKVGDPLYGRLAVNTQLRCDVKRVCKVSRNSFNPPPEVDSMVVKFEPKKNGTVDVDLNEFDGLLRICFNRKNRTLNAQFKEKHVLGILQQNLNSLGTSEETDIKTKVLGILESTGLGETRANKIDLNGFLSILLAFNKEGIHFTNETQNIGDMEID